MATFKDLQIGTKLGLGFGSVLLLLVLVSGAAYNGLGTAQDGFTEYRRTARNSLAMSELESHVLQMSINVKDYLNTGSELSVKQFQEYNGHVKTVIAESRVAIKNPERTALVGQIDQHSQNYEKTFAEIVQLTEQRQAAITILTATGIAALKAVSEIIQTTHNSGDTNSLLKAADLRAQLLTGRLYTARYLATGQRTDFDSAVEEMRKNDQVEEELRAILRSQDSRLQILMNQFTQAHDRYMEGLQELHRATEQRQTLVVESLNPAGAGIAKAASELRESYRNSQNGLGSVVQSQNEATVQFTLGSSTVAVLLGAFLAWLLSRMITLPIREAITVVQQIAHGDLSVNIPVNSRDEIGQLLSAMQAMNTELRRIVGDVKTASATVSSAAGEVSQGSTDLAQRTEEQASALEETASSMEELTATVQQNADNAAQASQLASVARSQVEQGSEAVQSTIVAMQAIHASSQKIAAIIEVIDGIAFQTNLLALNAAVEAARAGEDGRGFAVVAGEVRKLAQNSADAARQIKELIENSVDQVDEGRRLADASGDTLKDILMGVKKVNDLVAEIAVASREQASGIQQISTAVLQMDQATQQNAALVEETAAASQSMGDQASHLHTLMGFFQLDSSASGSLARAAQVKTTGTAPVAVAARRAAHKRLPTRPTRTAHPAPRHYEEAGLAPAAGGFRSVAVGGDGQEWEQF